MPGTPGSASGKSSASRSEDRCADAVPRNETPKRAVPAKTPRFRHGSSARYDTDFPINQSWVKISGNICPDFVDETPELDELYGNLEGDESEFSAKPELVISPVPSQGGLSTTKNSNLNGISQTTSPSQSLPEIPAQVRPNKRRHTNDGSYVRVLRSLSETDFENDREESFKPALEHQDNIESLLQAAELSDNQSNFQVDSLQTPNLDNNYVTGNSQVALSWPLSDIQEACLMRYFIDNLACWFDLCDPERHFALIVPQRASYCPALLNAIFTASARHLCRIEQFKNGTEVNYLGQCLPGLQIETAVEYHNRCIEHLVSLSGDSHAVFDENLLAASVILRFYEEVDAPFNGGDLESSLRASQFFIDAQVEASVHDTGLRRAAFRVAYRQEVVIAYINQRSFRLPIQPFQDYLSLEPVDDHAWAHRAVVHCAHVLMYCYGENRSNKEDYDTLMEYSQAWDHVKPQSFTPLFERNVDIALGEFHPEIWFLSDCHVTGVQHHSLSKILLKVYDPRIPRLGPGQRDATRRIEAELKVIVRRVCGMAISNRRAPPAMNTACLAIAICGDLFGDSREQQAMLDILHFTDTEHAWPTTTIQQKLKQCWGWNPVS